MVIWTKTILVVNLRVCKITGYLWVGVYKWVSIEGAGFWWLHTSCLATLRPWGTLGAAQWGALR